VNTAKFYPQHCKQPTIELGNTIRLAAQDLISALHQHKKFAPISLHHKHTEALRLLSEIFDHTVSEQQPIPRVTTQTIPSSSVSHTNPSTICTTPLIHQCITRSNKPMPEALPNVVYRLLRIFKTSSL